MAGTGRREMEPVVGRTSTFGRDSGLSEDLLTVIYPQVEILSKFLPQSV